MRRRRTRERKPRTCLVKGCATVIPGWQWLCDPHFKALPFPERKAIAEAGQERKPHVVAELCIAGANALAARDETSAARAAAQTARMMGERE